MAESGLIAFAQIKPAKINLSLFGRLKSGARDYRGRARLSKCLSKEEAG